MIRPPRPALSSVITIIALAATAPPGSLAAQQQAHASSPGLDLAGMDRSVKPGDDFFDYANGTWLKQTEIPADRSSYGAERHPDRADRPPRGRADPGRGQGRRARRLRRAGRSATTTPASWTPRPSTRPGSTPLQPTLDSIAAIRDRKDLARVLGSTLRADVDVLNNTNFYTENLLGLWVAQDLDDPTHYSPFLLQGGLGMPDRSYYVDSSAAHGRDPRQVPGSTSPPCSGWPRSPTPTPRPPAIVRLETGSRTAHCEPGGIGRRDQGQQPLGAGRLRRQGARASTGRPTSPPPGSRRPPRFVVWQPSAVTGISALAASEPLDTWKDYLTFHAIQSRAAVLPAAFGRESFAFFGPVLSGAQKQRDRWKRAVAATNDALGFAVGQALCRPLFPAGGEGAGPGDGRPTSSPRSGTASTASTGWRRPRRRRPRPSSPCSRWASAIPTRWPDYAGLEVVKGDAYGNAERAQLFQYRQQPREGWASRWTAASGS